jgi:transposase
MPLLIIRRPDQKRSAGPNNRMFVEAMLWIVRTGPPWRDLPERFGDWNNVFRRVAMRFKKTIRNRRAIITIAATVLW